MSMSWKFTLRDGEHEVHFHHGTISGKRVITLDGKEIFRQNWMFKLVGEETFQFGTAQDRHTGVISILPQGVNYRYVMTIDGRPLKEFIEERQKSSKSWHTKVHGCDHYVILDLESLEVFVDGNSAQTTSEFVEDATEMHFTIDGEPVYILTEKAGKDKVTHSLFVHDEEVMPDKEDRNSKVGWMKA